MNVLFLNSISAHKYGGGEKWMITAAAGMRERGHRVVVASKKNAVILKKAREKGVAGTVFNVRSDFSPLQTWRIKNYIEANQVDILICNLNKDVRVAGLAARLASNKPLVFARHGILLCGKKWKHRLTLSFLADGIITNTRTIAHAYQKYGWFEENYVQVLYNGVEPVTSAKPVDFGPEAAGRKVIFSAGRLSEQKGYEYLIDAAADLCAKRDDLFFAVAGKGKLEKSLEARVMRKGLAKRFVFLGFKEDMGPYLNGCDIFVLPSLFEGMPNAVMEAMSAGAPVISTDVNGALELTADGTVGKIVPARDSRALAEAIEELVDNPALRRELATQGQKRVRKHFTIDTMVNNLEQMLQQRLQEHRRTGKKGVHNSVHA